METFSRQDALDTPKTPTEYSTEGKHCESDTEVDLKYGDVETKATEL